VSRPRRAVIAIAFVVLPENVMPEVRF
jgi:hypothetical protein